ncbi:MAG: 2-amino-4-hydroxy-6-hydroxymethyldihydropteridine diphosphokinase [Gammaproteobacteria bacterium]
MTTVTAFIGIGSNLQDPKTQVRTALRELDQLPYTRLAAKSSLYRSDPMGPADQPDYINAVAAITTLLSPFALLDALLGIERAHGRIRGATRWGPRTLDLDILAYGDRAITEPRLTVPHVGIGERAFVLLPLAEIAPAFEVPGKGRVDTLAANCPRTGIHRLNDHD